MYFMPDVRGFSVARELALRAMEHARQRGFRRCYLETTGSLTRAIKLYESLGFEHIDNALGCTGHGDCEYRMLNAENALNSQCRNATMETQLAVRLR